MRIKQLILLISLLCLSLAAQAGYQLDNTASSLYFVSIKKNTIGEVHSFDSLSGSVDNNGAASVTINLASVKTNIEIRDERMKSLLFETAAFPTAEVSTNIEVDAITSLNIGERLVMPAALTLNLHGQSVAVQTQLQVIAVNGGISVSTIKPIMLNAMDFGLTEGVKALMEIASLPSIATTVPVSFNLVFKAD